jgi:SNF2 family DNA or RNA helicase
MKSLWDFQTQALANLPKNVLLSWETGLGKTLASLEHYKHHSYGLPILVAPPAKVNSKDWENEIEDYLPGIKYQVVSYAKLGKLFPEFYRKSLESFVVIFDELHYAKSATSQRGKACIQIAKLSTQFIGLSATFIPNGFIDLQTYGILFGWWKNKTGFIREHVLVDRSRGYPRIIGYRGEDRLKQLWQSVAFGLDKSHLNLPDLINITTTINLSPKQLTGYRVIKNTRELEDGTLLDTPSKLHATLRQYLSTTRTEALEAVLDDTSEHLLIFYNYNVEREAILDTVRRYDRVVYEQSGWKSDLPKGTPDKPSVTILQYMSGSAGLNLQYACITIFYSPSYSYQDMHQAKGRNHRGGTTQIVRHYFFRVAHTIDEAVYKCLEAKTDFNERIISDEDL